MNPATDPRTGPVGSAPVDRDRSRGQAHTDGMTVRRAVLGEAHVAGAEARQTDFSAPFQDLITRYAWGEIWTRPGLDRRMRSAITLTALIANHHWDEFALHVRAARRNGLDAAEIQEILLQSAIYLGVPSANHAFAIAQTEIARFEQEVGNTP